MKHSVDPQVADALHRLLVASVQDYAIFAVTADGHVASWNAGAARLKGYASEEIVGQHLSVFYPPEERGRDGIADRVLRLLELAGAEGRAEVEAWRVRRDGTRFWANVVVTPIRDDAGKLLGFAKVTRDLTERRQAEEDAQRLAVERAGRAAAERAEVEAGELQARYRQLFEASPLPSWTVDLDTLRILEVNEAAVERYGFTREEFSALTLLDLRDASAPGDVHRYLRKVRFEGQFRGLSRYRTKSGELVDVDISARTILYDGRPAVVAVLSDITAQLRTEGQQRFLVEASALLGSSLDYDQTLAQIVRLAVPSLADWAAYNAVDGEYIRSVAIHHADPARQQLANDIIARHRTHVNADTSVARVLGTGKAEFAAEVPDDVLRRVSQSEEHFQRLRALGFRSIINVPVSAGGRVLGVLGFALGESARRFTMDDLAFAEELGRRAGFALDNVLHFRAEQTARARAEALQRVTARLARAESTADVGDVFSHELITLCRADTAWVGVLSPDGMTVEAVGSVGYDAETTKVWRSMPLASVTALTDAVRTATPQWWESQEALLEAYPQRQGVIRQARQVSVAVLPLLWSGRAASDEGMRDTPRAVGGITVGFRSPHRFDSDSRDFLLALAQQCALAITRAQAFESEREAHAQANVARAEAEAANRTKSEFLATMSHELRTPLNAIGGYTELIELGIHGPVTPEQRTALSRIQRSQRALLALINEVLNFARLEAGAVHFDLAPVDLMTAFRSVEQFILPQVNAKGIRLAAPAVDPALAVYADADKLGQVLLNLLSNAVKFTDTGGEITLAGRTAPEGHHVDISVTDTGIGIPSDQLERIFEPFVQVARAIDNPIEGTGLGLAISRDLARGMHGELTARSEPGAGSTFTLRLPRA